MAWRMSQGCLTRTAHLDLECFFYVWCFVQAIQGLSVTMELALQIVLLYQMPATGCPKLIQIAYMLIEQVAETRKPLPNNRTTTTPAWHRRCTKFARAHRGDHGSWKVREPRFKNVRSPKVSATSNPGSHVNHVSLHCM